MEIISEKITSKNASKLTPFELRQELNRRNAFDLDESIVNYKTMLQRLMKELVAEEEAEQEAKVSAHATQYKETVDEAKRIREERKREALERSRQRQADKNYFQAKAEANVAPRGIPAVRGGAGGRDDSEEGGGGGEADGKKVVEEEELEVEDTSSDDPFRLIPSKGRNKVFVR